MGSGMHVHPTRESEYSAEQIQRICNRLKKAGTCGELGRAVACELQEYSLFDLQIIGGRLNSEIEKLPSPYREAVLPFFRQQLFGRHHLLVAMYNSGEFDRLKRPLRDPELFKKFCDMIPEGCVASHDASERNPYFRNTKIQLFQYLVALFTMFVLDEPGHPVGMPFPGGFAVEQRKKDYYCLIRDKEKEVFYSICNFCPALQSEESKPPEKK